MGWRRFSISSAREEQPFLHDLKSLLICFIRCCRTNTVEGLNSWRQLLNWIWPEQSRTTASTVAQTPRNQTSPKHHHPPNPAHEVDLSINASLNSSVSQSQDTINHLGIGVHPWVAPPFEPETLTLNRSHTCAQSVLLILNLHDVQQSHAELTKSTTRAASLHSSADSQPNPCAAEKPKSFTLPPYLCL